MLNNISIVLRNPPLGTLLHSGFFLLFLILQYLSFKELIYLGNPKSSIIVLSLLWHIREYGSTLYVRLACAVSPTNTNFRLTFLLTRLKEALYEDLAV